MSPANWNDTVKSLRQKLDQWRKTTFVFSTSCEIDGFHPRSNLYMWGHYGNGHRGVALEFDTEVLSASALKHQKEGTQELSVQEHWAEMLYEPSTPPLTAEDFFQHLTQDRGTMINPANRQLTGVEKYFKNLGIVKNEVWQREREWRLMWQDEETHMKIHRCPVLSDAVTGIVLGLNLGQNSVDDFVSEASRNFPNAKILRAKAHLGNLIFDQL